MPSVTRFTPTPPPQTNSPWQIEENANSETDPISQLERKYDVEIKYAPNKAYPYKVNGKALGQEFQFKSLAELERSLENGYVRRKAKMLARVKRWVTGRDIHNVKTLKKDESAGAAIVIDGGDDIAVSLENTGLSKQVVYTLQASTLYPLFMAVVYIGWKGASEEQAETCEEYQELQENIKEVRQALIYELLEAMSHESALKQRATSDRASLQDPEFLQAIDENSRFKAALIKRAAKLFKNDNWNQSKEFRKNKRELKRLLKELKAHNNSRDFNVVSDQINAARAAHMPSCSNLFDPSTRQCQDFIMKLADYQDALDARFGSFCEANFATPFTQSGLSSMFWGMGAYESRAIVELFHGGSSSINNVLSSVGDYFSVIGQAQMVLAGLFKIGLSIHEAKSVNEWIKEIEKSSALSSDEFKTVKGILKDFNKRKRAVAITEAVGNGLLTAGQIGMILGGGLGLALPPVLFAGVGATVAGVLVSQVAAQYTNRSLDINEQKSPKEEEIANFNDPNKNQLENIENRIRQLFNLSIENAEAKVLTDIYLYMVKNQNKEVESVLRRFDRKYQKYACENADHYRHLYYRGLMNLMAKRETRRRLNQARDLLIFSDTGGFSKAMTKHISAIKGICEQHYQDNIFNDVLSLLDFAEQENIDIDLYRRMTKRLVNTNGYLCCKEPKCHYQDYVHEIDASKKKRAWRIPNPLSPLNAVVKASKGIYRYIKKTEIEEESGKSSHFKINWGRKKTTVYVFDRDRFKQDLSTLDPSSPEAVELLELCKAMFTEKLVSEVKDWVGIDKRNVFMENIRHVYRHIQRDDTIRPTVYGVGEQVTLAKALEDLLELSLQTQSRSAPNDEYNGLRQTKL